MNSSGIYAIRNIKNNMVYIGRSANILYSKNEFIRWQRNEYGNYPSEIGKEVEKGLYSKNDFLFEIVELSDENIYRNTDEYKYKWINKIKSEMRYNKKGIGQLKSNIEKIKEIPNFEYKEIIYS